MKRHIKATRTGKLPIPTDIWSSWRDEGVRDLQLFSNGWELLIYPVREERPVKLPHNEYKREYRALEDARLVIPPRYETWPTGSIEPLYELLYNERDGSLSITPHYEQCCACGRQRPKKLHLINNRTYICEDCLEKVVPLEVARITKPQDLAATLEMKRAILEAYQIGLIDFDYSLVLTRLFHFQYEAELEADALGGHDRLARLIWSVGDFQRLHLEYNNNRKKQRKKAGQI